MQHKEKGYQQQWIINFTDDFPSDSLAMRWYRNHPANTCFTITGKQFLDNPPLLDPSNQSPVKIYIIGHGQKNDPSSISNRGNEANQRYDYETIAKKLAVFINDHPNVVVNLVVCEGGTGKDHSPKDSFGAKLHFALARLLKFDVPVFARRFITEASLFGHKLTLDRTMTTQHYLRLKNTIEDPSTPKQFLATFKEQLENALKWKQPGSKVMYTLKNDKQMMMDAYVIGWRNKVFAHLEHSARASTKSSEKNLLHNWLQSLPDKTDEEIYDIINRELNSKNSALSPRFFSMFIGKTDLQNDLKALLEEKDKMMSSSETIKSAPTGKGSPFPISDTNLDDAQLLEILNEMEKDLDEIIESQKQEEIVATRFNF